MIIGIGSDIIDIRRIEKTLARFGDRFTHRIYTERERARAERRPDQRAATYAKRFAAKEAVMKALAFEREMPAQQWISIGAARSQPSTKRITRSASAIMSASPCRTVIQR